MSIQAPPTTGAGARAPRGVLRAPRLLAALAAGLFAACAASGSERNLAPIWSHHSRAGGGEEVEALGGMLLADWDRAGDLQGWALRPFLSHRRIEEGVAEGWLLPPLGRHRTDERRAFWQLLPLFRYARRNPEYAGAEDLPAWTWMSLPGIFWQRYDDGRTVKAWFPFGGVLEHSLTFDRVEFVLWPLFTRLQRHGRTSFHFLWPIFSYSYGAGGPAWRVWPLAAHNQWEGRYDRWYLLWPFFQFQRNDLAKSEEQRSTTWMVFPLVGRTTSEHFSSTSVLWPFFGYSCNSRTGFWAWDGPWPLVRVMRPGRDGGPERTRFWPLYSHYRGDGLTSEYWLWPLVNRREEVYPQTLKESFYVLPFWRSWDRVDAAEGRTRYEKLWPLYEREAGPDEDSFAFPALNPLWRTPVIDFHYAWLWELYTRERQDDVLRERSWLGLWRRERDADEDRIALLGLWARRDYSLAGEPVRETSLLFGLLRFRCVGGGELEWLPPALPGPGWPIERVPRSIPAPPAGAP